MNAPVLTRPVYDCSARSILAHNGVNPDFRFSFSKTCGELVLDLSLGVTDLCAATAGTIMLQLILPEDETIMVPLVVSHTMGVARARFILTNAQYFAMVNVVPDFRPLVIPSLLNKL